MRKLRDLAREREVQERKGTTQTLKFFDKRYEVNKLPFSIKDTLLQIHNDIREVAQASLLKLSPHQEKSKLEYVDLTLKDKYLLASKSKKATIDLLVEGIANRNLRGVEQEDDVVAVERIVNARENKRYLDNQHGDEIFIEGREL
jgi:hypothetical protein